MITRAQLPPETLALSACVLDALSSQFGRTWRNVLSKLPSPTSAPPVGGFPSPPSETIVLAALKVSASFLDDSRTSDPSVWATQVGGSAGRRRAYPGHVMLRLWWLARNVKEELMSP